MDLQEKVGIEDVKKAIRLAGKNIDVGIEIAKDGLNKEDLKYAPIVMANIKELVAFIASKPEVVEQIKDIDLVEGYELLLEGIAVAREVAEPGVKV